MPSADLRINSCHSPTPRAPRQFQKNGFRLIINRVCGCDLVQVAALKRSSEKFVAQLPPRGFQTELSFRRVRPDIPALANEWQFMSGRQLAHELLIQLRFRASQFVVEVNDRNNNPELSTQLQQNPQQCYGICAAGYGNPHAVSGPQQIMLANVVEHRLRELVHTSMVIPAVWVGHSCPTPLILGCPTPGSPERALFAFWGGALLAAFARGGNFYFQQILVKPL